jgi:hypothetical protein
MKVRSRILCSIAIASPLILSSCSGAGSTNTSLPESIAVSITTRTLSVPESGTFEFTASVSNNSGVPQWSILDAGDTSNAGSLTPINGSPNSILYTAPPTPPVYNNFVSSGFLQGSVTVVATTTGPAGVPVVPDSISFIITAPSVTVSLSPTSATVPLGTTEQFFGYELGSANYSLSWQVNGINGGAVPVSPPTNPATYTYPYGSITGNGLYTAPLSFPAGTNTVTVTLVPQADPVTTESAVVTLQ